MNVPLVVQAALLASAVGAGPITQTPAQFYPAGDAQKQIDLALAAAKKDGRHVLLDFGADWCPDCRVLGNLLEDADVAPFVTASFHVVRIDVGRRDRNGDIATKYGATSDDWIPAIVVLAPDGARIAVTNETVRLTRRTSRDELLALLRSWAPKTTAYTLGEFVDRGVHVAITLDRDRSGGWWLAGRFVPTAAGTHLYASDLPADGIQGLGRPTRIAVTGSSIRATGPIVADRAAVADRVEGLGITLPIYPPGDVTLRMPVAILTPRGKAAVVVSYMACGPRGCLAPVSGRRVPIVLPARQGRTFPSR